MDITFHNPQKSLYKLSLRLAMGYEKTKKEFPNLKKDDARITVYSYCVNTVESVLYSMIFAKEQLADSNWYKKIPYIMTPDNLVISSIQENYNAFLTVALVTEYFACFETFFRICAEKLFPTYKDSSFYLLCEKLLKELKLKKYQHKFDLYRFIRNSLHNNGIVNDKHAYPILYNGTWYNFELGSKVRVTWFFLCQLSADLEECLNKIVHSEKIKRIDYLKDPSSFPTKFFDGHFVLK